MNNEVDYYKILNINHNFDLKTLKKNYRDLSKIHHPDKNKGDEAAEKKFKEVNDAYQTLSDENKRKQYDAF